MSRDLHLAAIQLNSGADPQHNFAQLSVLVGQAAEAGARLLLLPENALFVGQKDRDKLALAEAPGAGRWQRALADLARQWQVYLVCGSFPLRLPACSDQVTASCLVFAPDGQCIARYDKRHLFDVSLESGQSYRESRHFLAGDNAPQSFLCDGVRVGLSICYDLRFPELYRSLADQGVDVILVPAAFTFSTGQAHWEILLRARAIENLAVVVAANQCGEHPNGQTSWGHSMIVDAWGQVLAQTQHDPGLVQCRLDLESQDRRRRAFPVLEHRRP